MYKSFHLLKGGVVEAREWDGVTDRNKDGELTYSGDHVKTLVVDTTGVKYYHSNGAAASEITSGGVSLF